MDTTMPTDSVSPTPRVEVITSVQRRRRWSTAEKVRLVEEAALPGSSVYFVARRVGLHCRDGAVVQVLFAIDACDREVIAWSATTTGVISEMVCDLMLACVEAQEPRAGPGRT